MVRGYAVVVRAAAVPGDSVLHTIAIVCCGGGAALVVLWCYRMLWWCCSYADHDSAVLSHAVVVLQLC